jgi:hypothetical protein
MVVSVSNGVRGLLLENTKRKSTRRYIYAGAVVGCVGVQGVDRDVLTFEVSLIVRSGDVLGIYQTELL